MSPRAQLVIIMIKGSVGRWRIYADLLSAILVTKLRIHRCCDTGWSDERLSGRRIPGHPTSTAGRPRPGDDQSLLDGRDGAGRRSAATIRVTRRQRRRYRLQRQRSTVRQVKNILLLSE